MFKKWILVFCLCLACFAGIMGFINYKVKIRVLKQEQQTVRISEERHP